MNPSQQLVLSLTTLLFLGACSGVSPVEGVESVEKISSDLEAPAAPPALPMPLAPAPPASHSASQASGPAAAHGVIVKFKSDGASAVTDCTQTMLARGRSFKSATADQSSSLDEIIRRHKVKRAESLLPWRVGLATAVAKRQQNLRWASAARGRHATPALAVDPTNVYRLDLDGDLGAAIADLVNDPHVEYAQPNHVIRAIVYNPNDTYFPTSNSFGQGYQDLWGVHSIGAEFAWDSARGLGVVVAVVDTGVDRNHPDLSGNIWSNPADPQNGVDDDGNGLVDDTWGWAFASASNDTIDRFGHGTHVAGTIAAQDNNAIGIVGIAPDAKIMPIKSLGDAGFGDSFNLSRGVLYAAEHGADVINNSWGCAFQCPSDPVTEDAVKQANSLGSVVVFAAGNANDDVQQYAPGNSPYAVSVSASNPSGARVSFSNFGGVDVAAPGGGNETGTFVQPLRAILSLKSATCDSLVCPPELIVGGNYLRQAGTSMAAPHVAGLAALVVSQHPTYTPEQVRQVIRRSADDLNGNGYDTDLGYGRISAVRAMTEPVPVEALITSPTGTQSTYGAVSIRGKASGTGFQRYTLEYGAGAVPTAWTQIATTTTAVADGQLAQWDHSGLANGTYTLRLRVQTTDARTYEDRQPIAFDRAILVAPVDGSIFRTGAVASLSGALPPAFTRFEVVATNAVSGAAGGGTVTLTHGGLPPVPSGVLATWNTTGVAQGHYRLRITAFLPGGVSAVSEKTVVVDPRVHAGWPYVLPPTTIGPLAAPVVADLDQDGSSEIILASGNMVRVLKADGTSMPGWPQSVDPLGRGSLVWFAPAVGDVDGDGLPEIVVGNVHPDDDINSQFGELIIWRANGTLLSGWPRTIGGRQNLPTLANIDGDNMLEILVTDQAGRLKGYKANAPFSILAVQVGIGGSTFRRPIVGDLDRDGQIDIVVSSWPKLAVLTATGAMRSGWPKEVEAGATSLGDIDGDGDLEIVANTAASIASIVQALHHDGTNVTGWPKSVSAEMGYTGQDSIGFFPPALADLDGNGRLDIVISGRMPAATFGSTLPGIWAWNGAGQPLPGWPKISPGSTQPTERETRGGSVIADVNSDGQPDIIAGRTPSGFDTPFEFFNRNGSAIAGLARPMQNSAMINSFPSIADVDGDGLLEAVYIDDMRQVVVYDLDGSAQTPQPWPMEGHDPRQTSANEGFVLPARIEAERYVRFLDLTPTVNQGASGSPQCNRGDGVDAQATADNNGRCNIGWTQAGEWLEYDVLSLVPTAYNFTLRVATGISTARLRLELDGVSQGAKTLPQSNWQSFYDLTYRASLTAGSHKVRVVFETVDVNFNYLDISKNVVVVPNRIEAENYARFSDSDPVNQGAAGSPTCARADGVDIQTTNDNSGRCNVGWTAPGEWLEYDISVPTAGTLAFVARVAATAPGSSFRLELNGTNLGSRTVTNAGGQTFEDQVFTSSAAAGNYKLRVFFETANVNFNYVYVGYVAIPPSRLEAENYIRYSELTPVNNGAAGSPQCDRGDGVDIEATTDGNGRCNIGWVQPGEWLEYKVLRNSPNTSWSIVLRAGTGVSGKTIQVLLDGVNMGTFAVPNTGWGSFANINVPITIPNQNFMHDLRIVFPVNDVNLNYITLN